MFKLLDQRTLNPLPPHYYSTWNQINKDYKTVAVIFNVNFSSELPYDKRNTSIQLGSQYQSAQLDSTTDLVQFEFELNINEDTTYELIESYGFFIHIITKIMQNITEVESSTDYITIKAHGIGSKQLQSNALFLMIITSFILFQFNK